MQYSFLIKIQFVVVPFSPQIFSFAPDAVVLTQNPVDADQSDDSRLPSSADNKETPESPIGRTIRKRRSTPNRLGRLFILTSNGK